MERNRNHIFGMIAIAVTVIIAAGDVLAFSDEPCSRYNYEWCSEPAMTASASGWTITLDSVTPGTTEGQYNWNYIITDPSGGFTGSNFVAFLLPDCCRTSEPNEQVDIDEAASDPDLTCWGVAVGEPTIYFGRYNQQAFVCKGNPDNTGHWTIVANTPYKTRSTIIIKTGKDVLQFEMAVPGCPLAPAPTEPLIGSRSFSECSNFGQDTIEPFAIDGIELPATADDISFYVIRNTDRDGCVYKIWRCIGLECDGCSTTGGCPEYDPVTNYGCEEITGSDLPPEVVTQTAFIRTCPDENISVEQGSPFYLYTVNSGGYTYRSCLDLRNYQWVALTCCTVSGSCP